MDVFKLRDSVIGDYQRFIQGFLHIRDKRVRDEVGRTLADGLLWPEPWLSLNPKFTPGGTVDDLVTPACSTSAVVSSGSARTPTPGGGGVVPYRHQVEAIEAAPGATTTS